MNTSYLLHQYLPSGITTNPRLSLNSTLPSAECASFIYKYQQATLDLPLHFFHFVVATMDGFISITDKKVVKFIINTGTGKITPKRQMDKNTHGLICYLHRSMCRMKLLLHYS